MLKIQNTFCKNLPGDAEKNNFIRQVEGACYSSVIPTKVTKPTKIAVSSALISSMGWAETFSESQQFAEVFSGNQLLEGMAPYAMCYGGR